MDKLKILIIDDDKNFADTLSLNLTQENYFCSIINDPLKALKKDFIDDFDVIICDYKMPEINGVDFIKKVKETSPDLNIIFITAHSSNEIAIAALKAGAYDYLEKPFHNDELIILIQRVQEKENLKSENKTLKSEIGKNYNFENIIAKSSQMLKIFETIKRLSTFDTTVLVSGESGTGKELIAKALHYNSKRKNKKFIAVNCGAIPENLMESEFFGHKKGSFTGASSDKTGLFEEANNGTIFLDELGEMPKQLQVKLLRVLQEKEIQRVGDEKTRKIDVRIIAATLKDLEKEVKEGKFREDLFYRLNVINLKLPPLRERKEDLIELINYFILKFNKIHNLKVKSFPKNVMTKLLNHNWPGNVRELENCIERILILSTDKISDEFITFNSLDINEEPKSLSIKIEGKRLERQLISKALEQTNGNKLQASKILEISHRALLYKIKDYKL